MAGDFGENMGDLGAAVHAQHGVDGVAVLVGRAGSGQHALAEPGQIRDPDAGRLLDRGDRVPDPVRVEVDFGEHQPARGLPEVAGDVLFGQDPAQHLVGAPAHRGDRGDAEALVDFGAARVVDPGHHVGHVEGLARHPGGQDVGVVAAGHGREGIGLLDAGLLQRVPVKADAGDLPAGEARAEPPEGAVVLVDDGHRMAGVLQRVRQGCPDTATTHDHEVRHTCLLLASASDCCVKLYRPRGAGRPRRTGRRRRPADADFAVMTSRPNQTSFVWC